MDPNTFPIITLLRERRDFGITAAIIAAIVLSAAGAITAAVAMTNQVQSAQTINTVVEQTSAVMETQHRINKHLMSGIVAANQRMDLIQTQVEELFGMIQTGCIAKLKHMCVTPLRFKKAGNESREIASYLAGNWTRDMELLLSQQLLQIAALNETRVEPISLGDFTNWFSSAFSFFKEWVGVGIFGAICFFGVVLCLWFLCRLRARQVRDKAVIIQALAALEHGVSPQEIHWTNQTWTLYAILYISSVRQGSGSFALHLFYPQCLSSNKVFAKKNPVVAVFFCWRKGLATEECSSCSTSSPT
ncbi:hypothetical protein STEG23_004346 [Scotinomys teguina]